MSGPVSHNLNCAMPDRIFRPNTRPTHARIVHGYKLSDSFGMVPRRRPEMVRDALTFLGVAARYRIANDARWRNLATYQEAFGCWRGVHQAIEAQRPVNFVGRSK